MGRAKGEVAALLKELGFSHLEIAAELYPGDYRRYVETRDRRLYELLKKRVWRLLRSRGGPHNGSNVDPPVVWTGEFYDGGGERDSPLPRSPEPLYHPKTRKAGKKGYERQVIEYEQLLYYYYDRFLSGRDPQYLVWATAKALHGKAFKAFYERFGERVWRRQRAGAVARAYAYSVLVVSLWLHGHPLYFELRERLRREMRVDVNAVRDVLPIVISEVV